jgi:hypothetical protein
LNPQILDLNTFLAFDFSQCEIRVLAEISNDALLISQFQSGQDIHCLVGNTLTGWSVERIKKEKNLRKMVKNMVFGVCIAEDQMVLTERGEVPIQYILPNDKVWDGVEFVAHEGLIFQGYQEVVKHDGVTATRSHEVWTSEGRQIPLSEALAEGLPLLTTGIQKSPRQLSETSIRHILGHGRRQKEDLRRASLLSLQKNSNCFDRQYLGGAQSRVQMLEGLYRPSCTDPTGSVRSYRATVQANWAPSLRSSGDTKSFCFGEPVYSLHFALPSAFELPEGGYREEGQRRRLRSGKFDFGDSYLQLQKHLQKSVDHLQGRENNSRRSLAKIKTGLSKVCAEQSSYGNFSTCRRSVEADSFEKATSTRAVYDILNAGPRRRFTVNGKLVSNCYGLGRENLYPYIVMKIREIDGEKADLTGISPERVGKLYDSFFKRYSGVAQYIIDSREMAEKLGYVETLLEFRREISKEDETRSTYWGNQSINSRVQGTAHQLLLIAMALLHLKPRTFNMLQTPLMEIHDALDFKVKVRDLSEAYRQGKLLLEVAVFDYIRRHFKWRPRVPFLVEATAGFCLGSCVEYTGQPVEEWIIQWRQKHLESEAKSWKELAAKTV